MFRFSEVPFHFARSDVISRLELDAYTLFPNEWRSRFDPERIEMGEHIC
jgi:hypothetical protein